MSFLSYHKKKIAITKDTNRPALRKKARRYQLWVENMSSAEEIRPKDHQKMEYKMDLLECINTRLDELQTQKYQQDELLKAAATYLQVKAQAGKENDNTHIQELITARETFLSLSKKES